MSTAAPTIFDTLAQQDTQQAQASQAAAKQPDIFDKLAAGQPPASNTGGSTEQPSMFPGATPSGNMYPGAPLDATAHKDISGPGVMNAIGRGLESFAGHDIPNPFAFAHEAVSNPSGTVAGIASSTPPGQAFEGIKNSVAGYQAYEKARASGKGVLDSLQAASETMKNRDATAQMVQQRAEEFKKDPGAASVRALADAAALAAAHYVGAGAGPAAGVAGEVEPEAAAASTAAKPGILKQAWHGEKVAQAPARAALESGAKASAADAGVTAPKTAGQGVRRLLDEPIQNIAKAERATYDAYNKAADTDMKSLYDREAELQDAIEDPTNIANRQAMQKELKVTQDAIGQGESNAAKQGMGTDTIDKAKSMTQQRYSMENLKQRLFNNESVVEGNAEHGVEESINVKNAIKEVEKMDKPSRYAREGSPTRLVQALGEDGAEALKQDLYDAQRAGKKALTKQRVLKAIGGAAGLGLGQEAIHMAREAMP